MRVSRKDEGGFVASVIERPVEYRQTMRHGVIDTSLFESAMAIGLSDKVIMNVAGIFAWDIDFVYDIRQGDEYYVIYEELWQDGERVADGEIVAAEFVNRGSSYRATRGARIRPCAMSARRAAPITSTPTGAAYARRLFARRSISSGSARRSIRNAATRC